MKKTINHEWLDAQSRDVQRLVRAIRRNLSVEELRDVASHGADSGWSGFCYTNECARFYRRHADAIWELLAEEADSLGENIPTMIGQFNRVDMAESRDSFENLLTWFALEHVARMLTDY